jgi:hypothetical protein
LGDRRNPRCPEQDKIATAIFESRLIGVDHHVAIRFPRRFPDFIEKSRQIELAVFR